MPAAQRRHEIESGLPTVIPQRVNNALAVTKYYRSANLLIRQANEYRARHNDYQLYTMLLRLASLVVETIPEHKDFNKSDPQYQALRQALLRTHIKELESLKIELQLRTGADASQWAEQKHGHTPDTQQLSTSNLPQLDWDNLAQHPSPVGQPGNQGHPFMSGPHMQRQSSQSHAQRQQPYDLLENSASAPVVPSTTPEYVLPTFQTNLRSASQATRDRHALLPTAPQSQTRRQESSSSGLLYPNFDTTPYSAIDYGHRIDRQGSAPALGPPHPLESQTSETRAEPASLMDSETLVNPSYGPSLGPQEVEVRQRPPILGEPDPNGTCCQVPLDPPPPPPDEQPGSISTPKEIREVYVSTGLMEEFLAYARSNTRKGVESCGILAGKLDSKRGLFSITTLIVPKQEGTSDTVQALAEEEIFEAQDSRGLYPMGWIHTHPTQTCFLSSIDVHTQCGYQTMLEEAVAIVMAPSDRKNRCGIFRLSTPGGLKLVQRCQSRGFHMHPSTETGQPLYELCGHVYINEKLGHDVIDLR